MSFNFRDAYDELSVLQEGIPALDLLNVIQRKRNYIYDFSAGVEAKEVEDYIVQTYGSDTPMNGSIFITPGGKFIGPIREGATHSELIADLKEKGFIEPTPGNENLDPEKVDGIVLSQLLNYVYCNNSLSAWSYINLPPKQTPITRGQLYGIEEWLDTQVFDNPKIKYITILAGSQSVVYRVGEYFAEDLIRRITRYYSSGILYEKLDNKKKPRL